MKRFPSRFATARRRNVTELNNDGMIKFVDVHYQTEKRTEFNNFTKEI